MSPNAECEAQREGDLCRSPARVRWATASGAEVYLCRHCDDERRGRGIRDHRGWLWTPDGECVLP